MNQEQMKNHLDSLKAKDPERFDRAVLLAAFQRALYDSFLHHELCDADIIGLLVNSLVEMAEARGMTAPDLDKEITRCREIRALVKAQAEGYVQ